MPPNMPKLGVPGGAGPSIAIPGAGDAAPKKRASAMVPPGAAEKKDEGEVVPKINAPLPGKKPDGTDDKIPMKFNTLPRPEDEKDGEE